MALRVVVADDEPIVRRRIARLARAEPDVEVVAECADGREAIEAIREHGPDLVLLDVQMPEVDGFDVVAAVGAERMPTVIFVTAHDRYALRAFEVSAVDYVLKPFVTERFQAAFRRARQRRQSESDARAGRRLQAALAQLLADAGEAPLAAVAESREPRADGPARPRQYRERLMVKADGRVFFVRTADVDWIEAAGNYVRLHVGRAAHLVRETMGAVEAGLPPAQFARIHRNAIVNLDRVKEMQPWFSGRWVLLLHDGTRLRLSRSYGERLRARLGGAEG